MAAIVVEERWGDFAGTKEGSDSGRKMIKDQLERSETCKTRGQVRFF